MDDGGKSKSEKVWGGSAKQSCTVRWSSNAVYIPQNMRQGPTGQRSALLVDTRTRRGQSKQRKGTPHNRYARWRRLKPNLHADLAKSLSAQESFIVVWPQGYGKNGHQADCDKAQQEQDKKSSGKKVHSVDDVTFLSSMISIVQSDSSNNPTRAPWMLNVFFIGFWWVGRCRTACLGAFEHCGRLYGMVVRWSAGIIWCWEKAVFAAIMPLYTTGGTDDSWFEMSKTAHKSWSTLNECPPRSPWPFWLYQVENFPLPGNR